MFNPFYNQIKDNNTNNDDSAALMNPTEMATYLSIGRNLAYQLLNEGTIKGFKIGNQWKVSKQAIDLYIARNSGLV